MYHQYVNGRYAGAVESAADTKETAPDAHMIGSYECVQVCKYFGRSFITYIHRSVLAYLLLSHLFIIIHLFLAKNVVSILTFSSLHQHASSENFPVLATISLSAPSDGSCTNIYYAVLGMPHYTLHLSICLSVCLYVRPYVLTVNSENRKAYNVQT